MLDVGVSCHLLQYSLHKQSTYFFPYEDVEKVSHVFSHILVKSKSNLRSFSVFFTLIIVLRLCMYFIYQYFRKVSLNCVFSFIFFR